MSYRSSAAYNGDILAPLMIYPVRQFPVWDREMGRLLSTMTELEQRLPVVEEDTLYVGCGRRIPFAGGVCLDLDPNVGEGMEHFVCGDALALPFEDNRFSWVLSSHTLEHLDDCAKALREQLRVVKLGGLVGAVVPDVRWTRGLDPTHVREWPREAFVQEFQTIRAEDGLTELRLLREGEAEGMYSFLCAWRKESWD